MAVFVLVHGAWGGGWLWSGIARTLRSSGHEVHVPTLTGLGERSHLASPAIDLDLHVRDVTNLLAYEDLGNVILVGHSYGGMVITGVAAAMGERLRTLVYVDAFLPSDGQALWDIADEPSRRHYIDAQRSHPGLVAPFPGAGDGTGPGPRRPSLHPLLTLTQPVRLTGKEQTVRNRSYIYATHDTPTVFTKFYERVRDDPTWRVRCLSTGHMVMADDPDGLTGLLLEEAER